MKEESKTSDISIHNKTTTLYFVLTITSLKL